MLLPDYKFVILRTSRKKCVKIRLSTEVERITKEHIIMKKQMMILTAAIIGVLFTGCGSDPVQINVNIPTATVVTTVSNTAVTTEAVSAAETAAVTAVTESTVSTADTAAVLTVSEQTAAAQTTAAPAVKCPYSADDLVGEWSMPGTFGTRNNTMTVRPDGSVILRYAAGGTRFGKLRIDKEEHPDGTAGYWYSVYDDDNTAWIGFPCSTLPVSRIASGQDGEMEFVRVSLEDVAAEKMNNLTFLMKSMSGGGGDLETDANHTMTVDNQTYTLVTDSRFVINSLGKIAFERLLEETVSGSEYTHWKAVLDDSFRISEPDGQTYVITSKAHGYYTFETGHGVTITDLTDTSFTATTNDSNQLDGKGIAHFVFDGTNWKIKSYEFR